LPNEREKAGEIIREFRELARMIRLNSKRGAGGMEGEWSSGE
jgi:hypothetical protein